MKRPPALCTVVTTPVDAMYVAPRMPNEVPFDARTVDVPLGASLKSEYESLPGSASVISEQAARGTNSASSAT